MELKAITSDANNLSTRQLVNSFTESNNLSTRQLVNSSTKKDICQNL